MSGSSAAHGDQCSYLWKSAMCSKTASGAALIRVLRSTVNVSAMSGQ